MDLALPSTESLVRGTRAVGSLLDFFTPLDDARRLYRLEGGGELSALKVQAWTQREALSEPYNLDIACLSLDAFLVLAQFGDVLDRSFVTDQATGFVVDGACVLRYPDEPTIMAAYL